MKQNLKCWEIKSCPASFYLVCPAYRVKKNCWEVEGTRCSESHDHSGCKNCEVYQLNKSEIESSTPQSPATFDNDGNTQK